MLRLCYRIMLVVGMKIPIDNILFQFRIDKSFSLFEKVWN